MLGQYILVDRARRLPATEARDLNFKVAHITVIVQSFPEPVPRYLGRWIWWRKLLVTRSGVFLAQGVLAMWAAAASTQ